jgi:hypothetical protein
LLEVEQYEDCYVALRFLESKMMDFAMVLIDANRVKWLEVR